MKNFSLKIIPLLLLLLVSGLSADALSAKPLRVGPVQNYGALGTSGNKIISLSNKKQVMLRGMSLFWSDALGIQYYNAEVVQWAATTLGVDAIRFAMGIQYYKEGNQDPLDASYSFIGSPTDYYSKLDNMIEAAIENDIYIIVDWHSHQAQTETAQAKEFFQTIAQKYAKVPNVIFEIYNEPVNVGWSNIKSYAETVISAIRQYSPNLVLVGTENWSQRPGTAAQNPVNQDNVAYVLHFYAASHSVGSFSGQIESALNAGKPVFISEWGTTSASGDGQPSSSETSNWITYMEKNQLSNMNWSLRQYQSTIDNKSEQSAMFEGSTILKTQEALNSASYTASGKLVSDYLKKYKRSWADSLVAGSSGSCKFATQTVKQTAGTLTNVLKAGCTYASSDESVAIVDGSALKIVNAGFVILTANDGSKSIVIVEKEPAQTVAGFVDFRCRIGGSCNQSKSMANLTGSSDNEAILVATNKTAQGGTLTITSLDPSIVSVKWATCTGDKCYGNKGKSIYIAEFKKLGTTKLVATAPAVTGYRALSDTIEVIYAKGLQRIHSKFKSQTIPLGGTAESALPDTMMDDRIPVSYTYNSKESTPYFTKVGTSIVAGNQNAIVTVTATAPETDSFEEFTKSVTIIIGDSSLAVNKEDFYGPNPIKGVSVPGVPFRAAFRNSGMLLHVPSAGLVEWGIYSAAGVCFQKEAKVYSAGSHLISLENLPAGSYLVKIRQGNITRTSRWNKF